MALPPSRATDRVRSMDMLRGFAVMGILLMNIGAFAMPEAAYFNPDAWGGRGLDDRIAWAAGFVLIDGKMRGLFSLLFGASMLLLIERTERAGQNGDMRHVVRCFWLMLIGLAHYLLLWWGDILSLYGVIGLVALPFASREPATLIRLAVLAFAIHFLLVGWLMWDVHAAVGARMERMLAGMGQPGSAGIAEDIDLYRGPWAATVAEKAADYPGWVMSGLRYMSFDTLGFMLLGMGLLKNGFLTGEQPRAVYVATARLCFLIGLPPMMALAAWNWASGFDTVATFGANFAWSFPFRVVLTVGWAALLLAIVARPAPGALLGRVEAAGRMALSNYLATSLVMTALFCGWGFGLYGHIDRAPLLLFVPPVWVLMLLWSQPWLRRFRYGPAEWLWRSLTFGRLQPFRI